VGYDCQLGGISALQVIGVPVNRRLCSMRAARTRSRNRGRRFGSVASHHVVERHAGNFDLQVDSVE